LLRDVILTVLLLFQAALCLAQDHQAWALQQQEQSQELMKRYETEVLNLKNKAPATLKGKGCSQHSNLSCPKPQDPKQLTESRQENSDSKVYIFVSFGMPKEALKALAVDAKKYGAVLLIRGLIDSSFLKTATFVKELEESVVLDPLLFRKYNIVAVPTFIEEQQAGYKKISGNITLAYALSKFKEGDE